VRSQFQAARCNDETALHYCCRYGFGSRVKYGHGSTEKASLSEKATHRMKSPQSVPAPLRQWPPNNPTFREYEELKRQGWYKADKA
jgi:hypothetical protein